MSQLDSPAIREDHLDVAGEDALYRAARQCWHAVMFASDLGTGPEKVRLLGEDIVVARLDGHVRAFPDLCVHRGTALSLGAVEKLDGGEVIRCPYHGWTYGPDGRCTSIPARHGHTIPGRARLNCYRVEEWAGLIWLCLEGAPLFDLPEFAEYEDSNFRIIHASPYDWECSFPRRLENYVDFAHFAWVHDGVLGDRNDPDVPEHAVRRLGSELQFGVAASKMLAEATVSLGDDSKSMVKDGVPFQSGVQLSDKSYRVFMPGTVWQRQRFPQGRYFALFSTFSPLDRRTTRTFTSIARNYELGDDQDEKFLHFNDIVIGQDKPIVESQRPEELPADLSGELHIRGVDKVSIEYRRWLLEVARKHDRETLTP